MECIGRVVGIAGGAVGDGPQIGLVAGDEDGEGGRIAVDVGMEQLLVGALVVCGPPGHGDERNGWWVVMSG